MNITATDKSDYKTLADIHVKAFENFFLTSLGVGFLRAYYKASLKSNETISFCAIDEEGKVIGFSSGCTQASGFHKRLLLANLISFLRQAIVLVFTKPKAILRLFRNLDKNENAFDDGNYAELLSIGVLPSSKGLGVGRALIKEFELEAQKRGCKKVSLTTDYTGNQNVLSFYNSTGYEVFYEFMTFPDRKMFKLIKTINYQ
jgi:ribosomal protein S18 acetylase RimI-like enzyme